MQVDPNINSYIEAFLGPLKIKIAEQGICSNPSPNATLFARPLCLMREKETCDTVDTHFKPFMDTLHELEKKSILVVTDHGDGTRRCVHDVIIQTELSMIDGKMADLIQEDSGAFCHYCNVIHAEANSIERIEQGFTIENSVEDAQALESGELSYYDKGRTGQVSHGLCCHQMCGHNWELLKITGGQHIAEFSEQSSEAWNKHILAFKSGPGARARQTSIPIH